jgi:glycosyltransferase involved in cell wall biosynthesis
MRVGIDARAFSNINRFRGIGRYTGHLLRSLLETGGRELEPVLFTCRDARGDGEYAGHAADPKIVCFQELPVVQVPALGRYSWPGMLAEHIFFARRVAEARVDLFHGIDHNLSPFLPKPFLVTVHDLILLVLRGPYLGPNSWAWMEFHRAAARRAERVIAVSQNTARDVMEIWKIPEDRVEVVPEGVSADFHPRGEAEIREALPLYGIERPYLLYLGGYDPRKNILNLLLGFKELLKAGASAPGNGLRLVLAGPMEGLRGGVEDAVLETGLQDRVVFAGYVEEAHLPALYSGASAFVNVSVYEGFGLPLLEAMACGTPVVASRASSYPELVGEAAVLVDPRDPHDIARGLAEALEEGTARDLSRRGRERASGYTWERTALRILEIYRKVLS